MYATISDLLLDLFGINIPLPIQTFGFFLGLSFFGAFWATQSELKRKESNGLLSTSIRKIKLNEPISNVDYITTSIISAFVGFKFFEMVLDYDALVQNPQLFLLSAKGSWFGALVGGAYGYYSKYKEAEKIKGKVIEEKSIVFHPYQHMGNILAIAGIVGIIGAKIFHNLENLDEFARDPWGSLISFSGLTFYGGLIMAAIAVLIYTSKNNIPPLHMIDAAAPGLMLAYGIGRLGCHLSGDGDWGIDNLSPKPNWMNSLPDWIWSYKYPHNVLNEGISIQNCLGNHCSELPNPVFPTPFYEAIVCIFLFIALWQLRKQLTSPGLLFGVYLILNGTERFIIEKIRINTTYNIFNHAITQAELISSALVLLGLALVYLSKTGKLQKS